ncbi:MAG: hypothetical protein NTW59_03845 [Candidatus Diapherotrites archaeon]|nr:hypothetical protein [Candidatus Diapherotrites archaeon]
MHSSISAQVGLEYLLSYGWALIVVVTIASLIVVRFMPPAEGVNFSAGGRQIIIKASNIGQCGGNDSGTLVLQNAGGGQIKITGISSGGSFAPGGAGITVDGMQPPVTVAAGREIRLGKIDAACGAIGGTLNIEYTDKDGYPQTAEIRGLGNIKCCAGAIGCTDGQQRDCPLQFGVCTGAKETCSNGAWPGCTAATYGPSYEATEASCADLQDNDCDNKFDCDGGHCSGLSECEMYCTTNDARFPVKGGMEFVMHESQVEGDCLDWQVGGSSIYLLNNSGSALTVNNAAVSLGAGHFDDYTATNCGFYGHFPFGDGCGYFETFNVQHINGNLGLGNEACTINEPVQAGAQMQVGISNFDLCADENNQQECLSPINDYGEMLGVLGGHKDNPITIPLNTSIGTITLYCYNFPLTHCTDGEQEDCPLQFGVCAGAKETCANWAWPGCNAATYGASYETTETNCADLQDTDCDGKVDCDDDDCIGSDDCKVYATTYDSRFPVKGGIAIAYTEIEGCIEIIDHLQPSRAPKTNPFASYLSPQADGNRCVNWPIDGDTIYLLNQSGAALNVNSASVSLGPTRFDDYNAGSCAFWGRFDSNRCLNSDTGDIGGFSEYFSVTSVNGVPGSTQDCNINASIPAGQEIRVGVSEFSYCANRDYSLPPECECQTDVLLREHKDNPITITLNTNIGKIDIYLYNFPTDSPIT